jgi:hypothetical protein
MSPRERFLRRVVAARKRLRDVAAAKAGDAAALVTAAERAVRAAAEALAVIEDSLGARLERTPGVTTLELAAAEWVAARHGTVDAIGAHRAADAHANQQRAALRERERELRACERRLDQLRAHARSAERKVEQLAHDDLAGTKRPRCA